jgi:enoyl-CoA hydratase/carnithine racemase
VIRAARDGDVAIISLDRPEQRNALTPGMFAALHRELDVLAPQLPAALLLSGEGKVFCGGFDLKLCLEQPDTLRALLEGLHRTIERIAALDIPVVIAAQGAAIAGGCALLTGADVVVTNEGAKLGYPVTPLGISPAISAPTLAGVIGEGAARASLLDPSLISGREAIRLGLAHECVATPEQVLLRAVEIVRALSSKPAHAFAATKRWLRELRDIDSPPDARRRALGASLSISGGPEEHERLSALLTQPPRARPGANSR